MPEYLAPGVYVEEVSFRSKSIEGVPTSTTGFAGMTRYGPVRYPDGPSSCEPRLITSFTEFESVYGGLRVLHTPTIADERLSYVAHAARAFFMNGGTRLYVSRVFAPRGNDWGVASLSIAVSGTTATWRARWPGEMGNAWIKVQVLRSKNAAVSDSARFGGAVQVTGARLGSVVEIVAAAPAPDGDDALTLGNLAQISIDPVDGRQIFNRGGATFLPAATDIIQNVTLRVTVTTDEQDTFVTDAVETDPATKRYIGKILQENDPENENAVVWLDWDPTTSVGNDVAANLMVALQANSNKRLSGGHDGDMVSAADIA